MCNVCYLLRDRCTREGSWCPRLLGCLAVARCQVMLRPPPLAAAKALTLVPRPSKQPSPQPSRGPKQPKQPNTPPPLRLVAKASAQVRLRSPERPPLCHSVPASRRSRSPSRSVSPSPEEDIVAPDGYWQCLECRSLNSSSGPRSMFCSSCDARKPLQSTWEEGDWYCDLCGNHNYNARTICNNTWCPSVTTKPGDWICSGCGNHNYSSRKVCNSKTRNVRKPS